MVAKQKLEYVENLYNILSKNHLLAIANLVETPTSALQKIRKNLKSQGFYLKTVRKNLFIRTLKNLNDKNLESLIKELEENKKITILLIIPSKEINPFILNKILEENRSYRAARIGDILEDDVMIKAGPTNLTPGPVLTELKKYNIKTKVENGKIAIAEDCIVAKKGTKVDEGLASLLQKFNITPIPVKVRLLLFYDGKVLYNQEVLSTPLEKYLEELNLAFKYSLGLSINIGYPTKENINILLENTYKNSIKLSLNLGVISKDNVRFILSRTYNIANKLKQKLNIQ
ncbi:50S ribosomal protein L10 [Nanobdella aerobiophila]|uniref:50S ribosomal protein L10 n=1 Tax=Nanobdella aerobiophila TaxID=2586965 RepID=A0A915SSD2_9ARCH|nr:50S ribosomal protein L10 [Nanobdella aerobiophila]BBL45306.1 50S ribosomal protein L10 [Nanobdella aerobiophila]